MTVMPSMAALPPSPHAPAAALPPHAADRWLAGLGPSPVDVAQHLELAHAHDFEALAEDLLTDLMTDTERGFPSRRPSASQRWHLPRWYGSTRLRRHFAPHLAAALALATRASGPSAQRIRKLRHYEVPVGAPWWLHDSLESFGELTYFAVSSRWHREALWPTRMLCLPKVHHLSLVAARLGDERLARSTWELPRVTSLNLAFNNLTRLPDAVLALRSLRSLSLVGNPIETVPPELAALPWLHSLDLRRTAIRSLPRVFTERPDLDVRLPGGAFDTRARP